MASINDLKNKLSEKTDNAIKDYSIPDNKVEFIANSIDQALEEACKFFNTSRINLDYEVLEKARKGIIGIGKRPNKLLVWITGDLNTAKDAIDLEGEYDEHFGVINKESTVDDNAPIDGITKVVIRKSGIYLKVTPPKRNGQPTNLEEAKLVLASKNIRSYDQSLVKSIIKKANNEEVKIGEWTPNPDYDSKASIEISSDEMKGYVTVNAPILSGRIMEVDEIFDQLESYNISFGIMKEKVNSIFEKELYNVPVLIAEGKNPDHGVNASIEYKFKTDRANFKFEQDETGKIDYKNIENVQNVVAGQVLAVKNPASTGITGRTIKNNKIEAKDGNDIQFEAGKNTILSENTLEIIAQIAGQAVLVSGSVSVEPIYEVKGDINLSTGNIVFLGTVIVKGNVLDGFNVKAAGNIEVKGNIGNAEIEADNEIIVSQGILGKDGGKVKAGTNIFAKFIENAKVYAGNDVIVKEEILHSSVDAGNRVICHGKKGMIVGGLVRAGYEISAKYLGSTAYTDTSLEAGIDPKSKEKLLKLEDERKIAGEQIDKLSANITSLERIEKQGNISKEKKIMLERLRRAKKEFELQYSEIKEDIIELNNYIENIDTKGKISAKINVFPGVALTIKNATFTVKNDFKGVTFISENNLIKPIAYTPFEGDDKYTKRYKN